MVSRGSDGELGSALGGLLGTLVSTFLTAAAASLGVFVGLALPVLALLGEVLG